MFLPQSATIAKEKLTQYLLIPLPKDDKSKFLASAGYTLDNWLQLEQDLQTQVLTQPAQFIEVTAFGDKYLIHGPLQGANGVTLNVITVWMVKAGIAKFVTLVPNKGAKS